MTPGARQPLTVSELQVAIRATFAGSRCPPEAEIAPHDCEDCADLRATLAERSWKELPAPIIQAHATSLPLLSPAAFAHFLPAWMMYALAHRDTDDSATEHTIYALAPSAPAHASHIDWHRTRLRHLTAAQLKVIDQFMDLLLADPALTRDFDDLASGRIRFRQYWEERWDA